MCRDSSRAKNLRVDSLEMHGSVGRCVPAYAISKLRAHSVHRVLSGILRGGEHVLMRKLCVLNDPLNETNVVMPNTHPTLKSG